MFPSISLCVYVCNSCCPFYVNSLLFFGFFTSSYLFAGCKVDICVCLTICFAYDIFENVTKMCVCLYESVTHRLFLPAFFWVIFIYSKHLFLPFIFPSFSFHLLNSFQIFMAVKFKVGCTSCLILHMFACTSIKFQENHKYSAAQKTCSSCKISVIFHNKMLCNLCVVVCA